jgi:hypothetical protein
LVTVVPIFAPITIGIELERLSAPLLTMPTIKEVVVEELWKRTVLKTPIKRAIKGFFVAVKIDSATPDPICLIAEDIPLIPTKKRYIAAKTPIRVKRVLKVSLFIFILGASVFYPALGFLFLSLHIILIFSYSIFDGITKYKIVPRTNAKNPFFGPNSILSMPDS